MSSSYKPKDYSTVSPYLIVDGASATIDFLVKVFGAVELRRFADAGAQRLEVTCSRGVPSLAGGRCVAVAQLLKRSIDQLHRVDRDMLPRIVCHTAGEKRPAARLDESDARRGAREPENRVAANVTLEIDRDVVVPIAP